MFNLFNKNISLIQQIDQQAQKYFSLGDIANYRRAINDMEKILMTQSEELFKAAMRGELDNQTMVTRMQEITNHINFLKSNLTRLEDNMANNPNFSDELDFETRKRIYFLYHGGFNTQIELASFYGVKQPYISRIVYDHNFYNVNR